MNRREKQRTRIYREVQFFSLFSFHTPKNIVLNFCFCFIKKIVLYFQCNFLNKSSILFLLFFFVKLITIIFNVLIRKRNLFSIKYFHTIKTFKMKPFPFQQHILKRFVNRKVTSGEWK